MKLMTRPRRQIVLFTLLGLLLAAWGWATLDNLRLRNSLREAARDEVTSYRYMMGEDPSARMVSVVTTSHEYLFFGKVTGKVSVFIRTKGASGNTEYAGVDIGYERRGAKWVITDSGSCHGPDCVMRAREAFGDAA